MSEFVRQFEKRLQESEARQQAWIRAGRGHQYQPGSTAMPDDSPPTPATPAKPTVGNRANDHLFRVGSPSASTKANPAHNRFFQK